MTVVNGEIDELNYVTVNGLPSRRFSSILRKKGNQLIPNKIVVTYVSCMKSTADFLNKNKMEGNFILSFYYPIFLIELN